jgi:hypothetical protein
MQNLTTRLHVIQQGLKQYVPPLEKITCLCWAFMHRIFTTDPIPAEHMQFKGSTTAKDCFGYRRNAGECFSSIGKPHCRVPITMHLIN